MELRQLQYFVSVARKQHVTQAAAELRVAQSAISRQMRLLEEELGVQLFVHRGRNVQLTAAGGLFLERMETILSDLERSIVEVRDFIDPQLGEIRFGFPHSLGVQLVPSVVGEFRKQYPQVKFRFKQGAYHSLIRDVLSGDVDLALISPLPDHHRECIGDLLLTEELYAILPPGHPLAAAQSIRLEELRDDSFVLFSEGYSLRPIVTEACLRAGFVPRIDFEGQETDTIRGLVAAGMGVSLLPEMALVETSLSQPTKVRISEPRVTRDIGLLRSAARKLPNVAEAFRGYLLEHFKLAKPE